MLKMIKDYAREERINCSIAEKMLLENVNDCIL